MSMARSSVFASGRNYGSFAAGIVTGLSIAAAFHMMDSAAVDTLLDHINQLVVAITGLGGALTTVYNGISAWRKASPENQQASVVAQPDKLVIEVDPDRKPEAALRFAALSESRQVITTKAIADATPLVAKIVGPDAKPAAG